MTGNDDSGNISDVTLVKLMDREDMLERLKETNDPVGVTLEKWTLLMLWHRENGDIDPGIEHYIAATCALCASNTIRDIENDNYGHMNCDECIISTYNQRCGMDTSVWRKYSDKPSLKNARAMVELIEKIKIAGGIIWKTDL